MSQPTCQVCNITLPTAATNDLCDDCQDGITHTKPPEPTRHLRVIHSGNDDPGDYYPGYHQRRHG